MTAISVPSLLITQIYSDATGLLEAWQYFKETGDIRLLAVRYYCAAVHFILTLTQLRIIMNGRACFTAGTPLLTQRGWVPIEEITTDDYVWSRPEHDPSAPCEWKRVEELFTRYAQVQNLHVGGQVIGTTSEHPFWVVGQGWKKACELQKGDFLIGHDGRETPVEEIFDTQVFQPVYNLRVADYHTYFVGDSSWGFSVWAHNSYIEPKSYASTEQGLRLRQDAMALRGRLSGDTTYRNIATAEVTIGGRTTTVKFANTPGGMHSEDKLVNWYTAMQDRGRSVTVNAVYTDRNPCRSCDSLLANTFGTDLTVYRAQISGAFGKLW